MLADPKSPEKKSFNAALKQSAVSAAYNAVIDQHTFYDNNPISKEVMPYVRSLFLLPTSCRKEHCYSIHCRAFLWTCGHGDTDMIAC